MARVKYKIPSNNPILIVWNIYRRDDDDVITITGYYNLNQHVVFLLLCLNFLEFYDVFR